MKVKTTYTPLHVLMASPTEPMPWAKRIRQLTRMYQGLHALETHPHPSADDWRVCSDAVNLLETLIDMAHAQDESGLLDDAVGALIRADERAKAGGSRRLDGPGIAAVRAVLEDYARALEGLSERTIITAHRATEKRIQALLAGKKRHGDVVLVDA